MERIGKQLGLTYVVVRRVIHMSDLEVRPQNHKIQIDVVKAKHLYDLGLTFSEIREATGYSMWSLGKAMESLGVDTKERHRVAGTKWAVYSARVRELTRQSYYRHIDSVNPLKVKRGRHTYHVDHKYSIMQGFLNNIPPSIIAHWTNLEMRSAHENISKGSSCTKTIDELVQDFFSVM